MKSFHHFFSFNTRPNITPNRSMVIMRLGIAEARAKLYLDDTQQLL